MKTWIGREKCLENEGRLRIENEVTSFFKAIWVVANELKEGAPGGNDMMSHEGQRHGPDYCS